MHFVDYIVVFTILGVISFAGIFDFLSLSSNYGRNNKLGVYKVALSVASGYLSSISLLGFPSEIYFRGSMIYWYGVMYCIGFPIVAYIFLPILYNGRYQNVYQYLEGRFSFVNRIIASMLFIIMTLLYVAVALYAPALSLSTILNIPLYLTILLTSSLASIYLIVGGLRGGVITSALQMILILATLFLIIIISIYDHGFEHIYSTALKHQRLFLTDFRIDPRIRHSAPALIIGGSFMIISLFATNQMSVQRYQAMENLKKAQTVVLLNIPINFAILSMYVFIGIIMYSVFEITCHPINKAPDQILPYFVLIEFSHIPGLLGCFVAAVHSAGISTLTASYHALSEIIIEDIICIIIKKYTKMKTLTEDERSTLSKYLPLFIAVISVILALLIENLNSAVLQISLSVFGAFGGLNLGIFIVAMFFPWIKNKISATISQLVSLYFIIVLICLTFYYKTPLPILPIANKCDALELFLPFNYLEKTNIQEANNYLHYLSQISYQYYTLIGVISTIIISHIVEGFILFEEYIHKKFIKHSQISLNAEQNIPMTKITNS
ncbi:Sodium/solute symporter family and Sodium/solute symporter, subgroup family-containing protein [Strongyloides ratti]|uniref:Sodium/solute symporter family and Sodium/solute symporter, subgroup family-containing protein n=1 Tax=Strongyloides ratti TaxID=34506 RepID=A0A090L012_STRRB|nr:Sodium/solute symporter family and Sodium/solute symporter, subgroup family-containing protein [Strongyloides ratti]CEF60799.1 Sodium/solute symporter family and Sodium/solute symporter, subgroup family-containing protein [Strongyloides ratti]